MNDLERRRRLSGLLSDLSDELDVSPAKYRDAKDRYDAVTAWLGAEDSELARFEPTIYPQGSFALGTAVRPVGDDDYDVDAVCLLRLTRDQVTQRQLKKLVGDRLKHPSSRYRRMLKPPEGGRRCWTIRYADSSMFHLDILPAIPDEYGWLVALGVPEELAYEAICLTDRETWDRGEWPRSNPKGYVAWFKAQMRVRFEEAIQIRAQEKRAEVEEIEDFEVRTPLQRLIQILKRHRDVRYNGDDDRPISMIITTLAARAYDNEGDLAEAILNVVPRMRTMVENRHGAWWVENPVNPRENFADKWAENPRKAQLFFEWIDAVEREHGELLSDRGWAAAGERFVESYGPLAGVAAVAKNRSRAATQGTAVAAATVLLPRKSERAPTPKIDLPSNPGKPWGR